VAVDQLEQVRRVEGKSSDQHLVHRHAQRVQIGAIIDVAVHPAGLLGRHVRDSTFEQVGMARCLLLAREPGGNAEIGERHPPRVGVDDDVVRVDVLVNDAEAMELAEYSGELNAGIEGAGQQKWAAGDQGLERDTAGIVQHKRDPVTVRDKVHRPCHTFDLQGAQDRKLAAQAGKLAGGRELIRRGLDDHRQAVRSPAAAEHHPALSAEDLMMKRVAGKNHVAHGGTTLPLNEFIEGPERHRLAARG
jgi:hypothetical protein